MFLSLLLHEGQSTTWCVSCSTSIQVQVSGSTHNTVLKKLQSDTVYTVTVVPVYSAGEGQRMSENGKTCKPCMLITIGVGRKLQWGSTQGCLRAVVTSLEDSFREQTAKKTSENDMMTAGSFFPSQESIHVCPDWNYWPQSLACCNCSDVKNRQQGSQL